MELGELSNGRDAFTLYRIGTVSRGDGHVDLVVDEPFRPALKQLDKFSHVIVVWWVDQVDPEQARTQLTCEPPYAAGHLTGVFACRAEYRPNPIAFTPCRILSVDEEAGVVRVNDVDALDGSPIVDLKAYFPVLDRVRDASIPDYLEGWPEWLPDDGVGLEY
jgi:tRNA-Thr(GGU) m(6)t(6)A37 methyltransferase TsaA